MAFVIMAGLSLGLSVLRGARKKKGVEAKMGYGIEPYSHKV